MKLKTHEASTFKTKTDLEAQKKIKRTAILNYNQNRNYKNQQPNKERLEYWEVIFI